MRLTGAFQIINLIRELDLGEIRDEAEQRFDILVLGQPILSEAIADRIGATPGRHGLHPWIAIHHLPIQADAEPRLVPDRFTLAIVVTENIEPSLSETEALRRLEGAGVATVVAVMSDDALGRVGSDLVRSGEHARTLLSSQPTAEDIVKRLAPAILEVLPSGRGLRVAFARRMPALREPFIRSIVDDVAQANAFYSMTTGLAEQIPLLNIPLNAADVLVLTKNQLLMAYKIALAAGKSGRPAELMGEIVSVLGGGFLFREVARKLVGLIPVIGLVPKVAVSYAGTRVIGTIVQHWASEGRRIRIDEMHTLYDEAMRGGRELARSLADRLNPGGDTADPDSVGAQGVAGGDVAGKGVAVEKAAIKTWEDDGGADPSVPAPSNGYAARRIESGDGGDGGSVGMDAEEADGDRGGAAPA